MTLVLLYLVVLILIAIVLFGVASVVFGRGEQLPPLPKATTATVLPASGVTGADVDDVKFDGKVVFTNIANGDFLGLPNLLWMFVVVVVIASFVLRRTVFGRSI